MTAGRALAAVLIIGACGKQADKPPPAPALGSDLPDPLTLDWKNLTYDLSALQHRGAITARGGRVEFGVIEDDDGLRQAVPSLTSVDWTAQLELDKPSYADLDGDGHDEAVIPFDLNSSPVEEGVHQFGAFVFTLRGGNPIQLATITTPTKNGFRIAGSKITTADGNVEWSWDKASGRLVESH